MLVRVKQRINKDTELHPLVRWQYRGGLRDEERKAFLFENVVDSKGRAYGIPVVVGALAGSQRIYQIGMGCDGPEEMERKWSRATGQPIEPALVEHAPCQEVVYTGEDLTREGGGLDALPVPISTPGFDNAPYTTCSHWITKDPDTGVRNMGNYRGQIKNRTRVGIFPSALGQDVYIPNQGLYFADLKTFPVHYRRLRGTGGAWFDLAGNRTIEAHISEIPPGGHNNMHRHVNEAIIYILSGRGYSIIEEEGKAPVRVDWAEGDLFSPPLRAWHQHFNTDAERPARYLAITNVPLMTALGTFVKEQRGR